MAVEQQQYRPVARTIEQLANDYVKEQFPLGADFEPNLQIVSNAINAADLSNPALRLGGPIIRAIVRGIVTGRDVNEPGVRLQIVNAGGSVRYQLCENPRYREALDGAFKAHGKAQSQGPEGMIVRTAIERNIALDDAESLADIVAEFYDQLPNTAEHDGAVRAANSRLQMINEITKNGTQGFTILTQYGGRRVFDKDGYQVEFSSSGGRAKKKYGGFENMSDEEIRQIHAHVMEKRAAIEMAKNGTLKKQVNQLGKDHYQGKFHGDPGSRQPSTPATAAVLVDPRNGQPITTRLGLIAYINSSDDALYRLVKPKGTTIGSRALEVDRLLGAKD